MTNSEKPIVFKMFDSWVWLCENHSQPIASKIFSHSAHRDPWSVALAEAMTHAVNYHGGVVDD